MTDMQRKTYVNFVLPPSVVSRIDVSRLVREVEAVDNALTAVAVRAKAGATEESVKPTISERLADFLRMNELTLTDGHERGRLITELRQLKDKVPIVHMTFAVEADPDSLAQLVQWLRQSIHPQVVIRVGLQPALVAGVYLRTPNHVHDLSLRAKLQASRDVLVKELGALRG